LRLVAKNLYGGWSLYGDPATGRPYFKRKGVLNMRSPFEVARLPEGRNLYRAVYRLMQVMDVTMDRPGRNLDWKVVDLARIAMVSTMTMYWHTDHPPGRKGYGCSRCQDLTDELQEGLDIEAEVA
jgi:hypothetical protein